MLEDDDLKLFSFASRASGAMGRAQYEQSSEAREKHPLAYGG